MKTNISTTDLSSLPLAMAMLGGLSGSTMGGSVVVSDFSLLTVFSAVVCAGVSAAVGIGVKMMGKELCRWWHLYRIKKRSNMKYSDKSVAFVRTFYTTACSVGLAFGMNPVVILAQAALESNWGCSRLAQRYYNFFGLIGTGAANEHWDGSIVLENRLRFRIYKNPEKGFADFVRLIKSKYKAAYNASFDCERYAVLMAGSSYISDQNGDNREAYHQAMVKISRQVEAIVDQL